MGDKNVVTIPSNLFDKIGMDTVWRAVERHLLTAYGRERLEDFRPLRGTGEVSRLCRESSEMIRLLQEGGGLPLEALEPVSHWLRDANIEGNRLPAEALPPIAGHARATRLVREALSRSREEHSSLWAIATGLVPLRELEEEIGRTVDSQGRVLDRASNELAAIRSGIREKRVSLRRSIEKLFRIAVREKMASDEGPTLRNGRMVIPVRAEFRRKVEGFVHDVSASGQTVYIEPASALQLNNDLKQLEAEEAREIDRILLRLTGRVRADGPVLVQNGSLLGALDLIHARVRFGLEVNGRIPECADRQQWRLIDALNPGLLLKQRKGRDNQHPPVIPLRIDLGSDEVGIIISGPNAGGKSVALKTLALFNCMFQCGIPVPAGDGTMLPVIDGLFLDMGDDQSIEHDLSTFSSRLEWMRQSLPHIGPQSLVLIDEAGTGTDPDEGGALFQAFMEEVLDRDGRLLATTHHGSLKVFAHDDSRLANAAMEFDQKNLSPTFRFRKGVPGSSFAFEIAGRMKLPDSLLERARGLLGRQRENLSNLLLSLERELEQARSERSGLRTESERAAAERERYRSQSEKLQQERNLLLQNAYREADRIMDEANRKIEQAVEQIRTRGRASKSAIQEARTSVERHKREIRNRKEMAEQPMPPEKRREEPAVGDRVRIRGGESTGELVERDGNRAVVVTNGLRLSTTVDKLEITEETKRVEKVSGWLQSSQISGYMESPVSPTLNLRGMRGEEAVRSLVHYLDRVVTAGLTSVEIVHGKGDGILQKLVHEHLSTRSEVASYELAPWERGGPGCTIVHLN